MFLNITRKKLISQPGSALLLLFTIILGTSVATALAGIYGEISQKMALELRSYGANILLEPDAPDGSGYLMEKDLNSIKTIFWKHNIKGFAPYLYGVTTVSSGKLRERTIIAGTWFEKMIEVPGEENSLQGVRIIAPWWSVQGEYPGTEDEVVIGAALARRLKVLPGSPLTASFRGGEHQFRVSGIVTTGGYEDEQVFGVLQTVQQLMGRDGQVSRVQVSALTVPMDAFGRRDPKSMSKADYEKWYCTAYVTSVAKNLEEAVRGSRAKPVWQIASAEGSLLTKLDLLMILLTFMVLAASLTSISACSIASVVRRQGEIALMKALGADRIQIAALLLGEMMIFALVGGGAGYLLGEQLAELVSRQVFNSSSTSPVWLFATAMASSLTVTVAGSLVPLQRALAIEPVRALR